MGIDDIVNQGKEFLEQNKDKISEALSSDKAEEVSDGALELWDSTLASLSRLGGLYRNSTDTASFLERIRARAASHDPGDDLTVVVVARDA